MVSFKKNSILTLLFLNKFFVLAYQPADSLSLIEEKLLNYNEIPISLKIMADKNTLENHPEFLKYSEDYKSYFLLDTDIAINLESDCNDLNVFEPFKFPTTLIFFQITDKTSLTTISKCVKDKTIIYSKNIQNDQLHSS